MTRLSDACRQQQQQQQKRATFKTKNKYDACPDGIQLMRCGFETNIKFMTMLLH